jgi:zinc protease
MPDRAAAFPRRLARRARLVMLGAALTLMVMLSVIRPAHAEANREPLWPHLGSDLAPDPSVTFGVLPNGMRYALKANSLPKGAVSVRFAVDFGSMHETPDEAGYAHFIEHMAFNGSTNVPEGEMVRRLQRFGLAFGAHANASTSHEHTVYKLELPNASDALIEESLLLMRETASELAFSAEAIEREKGVVLAEHRRGDTFARRRSQQAFDFLLPGALAASRMPIGTTAAIAAATRDRLVDLYQRYYRPERALLVVVGDFDLKAIERKIAARFSDWRGRGPAGAEPDAAWTPPDRDPEASVFVHPDGGDALTVYALAPLDERPDTAALRRETSLHGFGVAVMNRRLRTLEEGADPPFRRAAARRGPMLRTAEAASVSATIAPGEWRRALKAIEQEWRRALEHGFSETEIADQIAAMRTNVELAAQREATRQTPALAEELLGSLLEDRVFTTPSSGLDRFNAWSDEATPEAVLEAFRSRMGVSAPLIFYSASREEPGTPEALPAAWAASALAPVAPPEARALAPFAYTDFGPPGRVVADEPLEAIGARLIRFENNVRLNLKRTTFQTGSVMVSLRLGAGPLDFPEEPLGLDSLMQAFSAGGLEKHSADDLRGLLAGRAVQAGFSASASAFGATYRTTPADLLLQLQVAAAFMTSPGYRIEAERRWRQNLELSWPRLDANAQAVLANAGVRELMSGDRRFGRRADDGVSDRTFEELRARLDPILQSGAIEIAIVGDVDEAAAIEAVAKTFGALPKRAERPSRFREDRPARFRDERAALTLTHRGEPNQALVTFYWPVVDVDPQADPQAARVLNVLGAVMRLKVTEEVREKLGAAYSPAARAAISSTIPGWGYLSASSEVRPEDADTVAAAMRAIAADLEAGRISEDELKRAVTPMLETLPQNATSNGYWLSLLSMAQTRPELTAAGALSVMEAGLRSITIADLAAAARRYLIPDNAHEVRILPGRP